MSQETKSLQKLFFERLSALLPKNLTMVDVLSGILGISNDSIYRRIRGETPLQFEEISKICKYFNISFDSLVDNKANTIPFGFISIRSEVKDFKNYLSLMLKNLEKIGTLKESLIRYAADDIPFFYLFHYPDLASFKMFYWMKSVLQIEDFATEKFKPSLIDTDIIEIGEKLLKLYSQVPSIEIWNEHTVISLCKQIEYYWETDLYASNEIAETLCVNLMDLLKKINRFAEKSSKNEFLKMNNFKLYYSDVEVGNNAILVSAGDVQQLHITFNTFNSLSTDNSYFCREVESWFNNLIKKSTLISDVSEKQRLLFFNNTFNMVDKLRRRISPAATVFNLQ